MENKGFKRTIIKKNEERDGRSFIMVEYTSSPQNVIGENMNVVEDCTPGPSNKKRGPKPKTEVAVPSNSTAGPSSTATKPKTQVFPQSPVAGPSRFVSYEDTVIEETDCMVICRYKFPQNPTPAPTKPFEIIWGEDFLKTLLPKFKKGKSILKNGNSPKKTKNRPTFSQTTVYYFEKERKQGSGMKQEHFYSNLLPVEVYDSQKEMRHQRSYPDRAGSNRARRRQAPRLRTADQNAVTHTIQVPLELVDGNTNQNIPQTAKKGCTCTVYCDPDICQCHLNGRQCEVFEDGFPCGCEFKYCKNANGRKEYNRGLGEKTREIQGGRVDKRKQAHPTRSRK